MGRSILADAASALRQCVEPPALAATAQMVRAAGVLLPRDQDPKPWAKDKIEDVLGKPVYSI